MEKYSRLVLAGWQGTLARGRPERHNITSSPVTNTFRVYSCVKMYF